MKKMILIVAILTMPFMSFSQTESERQHVETVSVVQNVSELNTLNYSFDGQFENAIIGYKKVERISKDPRIQNKVINAKKSNDLISIKAYIRSLQMKRKETLMS